MKQITLAAARVAAGLTQDDLARKMGVSRSSVTNWERGKTVMRPASFYAFCYITGFDARDIILPEKSTKRVKT